MRKFYFLSRSLQQTAKLLCLLLGMSLVQQTTAQGFGTALSYNATTINPVNSLQNQEYLNMPAGVVQSLSQSFTIEAWIYWRGIYDNSIPTSDENQRVFDFGTSINDNMWLTPKSNWNGEDGVMFAFITTASGVQVIQSTDPLPTNTWVHVAITLDHATNTGKLFVNGVLDTTTTITIRPSSLGSTTNNYLGRSQFLNDPYFNGIIDEFRISNNVRYTSNFTPATSPFTSDANTVLLYHFSEGSGQTTADASSNGFNAILGLTTALEEDLDPDWIANSILPVKLESFTAQRASNAIDLKWSATITGEGGQFVIERSFNGSSFEPIGEVEMNANAGSVVYSFRDAAPAASKNFYRLRILETNAAPKLSGIIWIDMSGRDVYSVHPTATYNGLFINIPSADQVSIYNASGILVKRIQMQSSQQISVQELPKGMYHLQFEKGNKTVRFIRL